jgi:hypothetical protein
MHRALLVVLGAWGLGLALQAPAAAAPAWEEIHRRLGQRRDVLARDLEGARRALRRRAAEEPALLARLAPRPVEVREVGWGVLPEILDDEPSRDVAPRERRYALADLASDFDRDFRLATALAERAERADLPLEPLVEEFEWLRERLGLLEDHLGYHAYWQRAVIEYLDYFRRQNVLVARAREMVGLREVGERPARVTALRSEIRETVAPFRPAPGLRVERRADGTRVLPVVVTTDVADVAFLDVFQAAVRSAFSESEAARARRFRVELTLQPITPETLYGTGRAPVRGATLDVDAHLDRFPAGALVLTTGETSTHAWTGRAIVLGPTPINRRTLAHEFGHLLGFQDAYLRGFDGDPGDPFGIVLVEWTGLTDDLMGDGRGGRVTLEMIDRLLEAYGTRGPTQAGASPRAPAGLPAPTSGYITAD